jgi:hypothetical protein
MTATLPLGDRRHMHGTAQGAHLPPPGPQQPWPEFVRKEQERAANPLLNAGQEQSEYYDYPVAPRPAREVIYDLIWPVGSAIFVGLNLMLMMTTYWGMFTQYDPWKQGQTSIITGLSLAGAAMIYKWVVKGPDGPPALSRRGEA